jgi:hypothetical protein
MINGVSAKTGTKLLLRIESSAMETIFPLSSPSNNQTIGHPVVNG